MSYSFKPMTEDELNASNLVDDGIYSFQVMESIRKTSKAGNPMAELNIKFWDNEGNTHLIFDYLVFSTVSLNIRKIKHFCDATGLTEEYNKGHLPEMLSNLTGKLVIGTQDQQSDGKGGFYPRKNVVKDYLGADALAQSAISFENNASKEHADLDFADAIPF